MLKSKHLIIILLSSNNAFAGDSTPMQRQLTPDLATVVTEAGSEGKSSEDLRPEEIRAKLDIICKAIREKISLVG